VSDLCDSIWSRLLLPQEIKECLKEVDRRALLPNAELPKHLIKAMAAFVAHGDEEELKVHQLNEEQREHDVEPAACLNGGSSLFACAR
jgi:hypothetical protein